MFRWFELVWLPSLIRVLPTGSTKGVCRVAHVAFRALHSRDIFGWLFAV